MKPQNPPPEHLAKADKIDSLVKYAYYPFYGVCVIALLLLPDLIFKFELHPLALDFAFTVLKSLIGLFCLLVLLFTLIISFSPKTLQKLLKTQSAKWRRPVEPIYDRLGTSSFTDRFNKQHHVKVDFRTNAALPVLGIMRLEEDVQAFFNSYFQSGGLATSYADLEKLLDPHLSQYLDPLCLVWFFRIRSIEPPLAFFDDMPIGEPI